MQKRRKPSSNRKRFFTSFLVTIVVALLVLGGGYAAYRAVTRPPSLPEYEVFRIPVSNFPVANNPYQETENDNDPPTDSESDSPEYKELRFYRRPDFITILIYGVDDGNDIDSLMVAGFDAANGSAYLLSLPRDTRVYADRSVGRRKLVASYSAGRGSARDHDAGINQLKTEVSTLLGFRPDFYVGINFRGFERLIDAIGGVYVTVPFHMRYDVPVEGLHINLQPGHQRLNGQQALHFVRFRQANYGYRAVTDFQRQQHQQQVISSAANELLSVRTIGRLPELVRIYQSNVTTNLSTGDIGWLLEQANGLQGSLDLSTYTLPIARTERQGWYEIPDGEAILELVNSTVNPFTRDILPEMLRIIE